MLNTAVGHQAKGANANGKSAPLKSASRKDEKLDLRLGMVLFLTFPDSYCWLACGFASWHFNAN